MNIINELLPNCAFNAKYRFVEKLLKQKSRNRLHMDDIYLQIGAFICFQFIIQSANDERKKIFCLRYNAAKFSKRSVIFPFPYSIINIKIASIGGIIAYTVIWT